MTLTHERYGGEWPLTDLYGFVLGNDRKWRGLPVYLLRESAKIAQPIDLKSKDKMEILVRLDCPGTGSVKTKPLIGDFVITGERGGKYKVLEGNYKMRFVLVFRTKKNIQYTLSKEIGLEVEKYRLPIEPGK